MAFTESVGGVPTITPASISSPVEPNVPAVHPARCNLCLKSIVGIRHKCCACPDFDSCESCFSRISTAHPLHRFVHVKDPKDLMPPQKKSDSPHGISCNNCQRPITGIRYKCMTCENPVNFCENCEASPVPVHPTSHPLAKFKEVSSGNDGFTSVTTRMLKKDRTTSNRTQPLTESNLDRWNTNRAVPSPPRRRVPSESDTRSTVTNTTNTTNTTTRRSALTEEPDQCPVCFEERKGQMVAGSSCGHMLCRDCQNDVLAVAKSTGDKPRCYSCRRLYD
ncbi:uncharacterized protein EI90DRAFT_3093120 [Cantharellus anzutake]|uniref:uncharacterized protein n=1 Tax=Cantharellus anzutake TaxID=1750568 RepID=UPI001906C36D|nr:uncharacterized protein EI90DRAFT_3093120 [Cantharellus anzutake]KAF8312745.1 hypothetical protein EI90DRAFT_3093120 [Cantharellus anzutake]